MSTTPTDEAVLSALHQIREQNPALGLPKVHAELKQQHGWQLSLDRLRKLASANGLTNTTQLYTIKPTPDKGLGAFATRAIQPGTVVISESPIVVTRPDSVNFAFDTLTDAQKTLFMSFSQSPATSVGRSTQSTADRIFRNNAYLWHPAQHPDLAGIFPTLPRFNHHCSPTLTYQTDHAAGKGTFVAIVPAGAGQELCTSYCERVHIRRVRQKQLHETYGFTCACSTCSLPEAAQKESDLRRFASRLLDEAVMKPLSKTDRLRSLHLRLRLLREEGLSGPDCARSLNDAVQVCEHEQGERSSDANDANEALAGYAKLAAAEYVRGGNFGEAAEIESTLKKKGQSSTKNAGSQQELKELWARLDSLDALDYETQEAREEWEEAQVEAARGELERISS